jgi:hypothetical protein
VWQYNKPWLELVAADWVHVIAVCNGISKEASHILHVLQG